MTRRSLPTDQTHALARIATDVASLRRDVADLAELRSVTAAHSRALEELSAVVGRSDHADRSVLDVPAARASVEAVDGEEPAPDWLTVDDPATAIGWLNELVVWVPLVWQRHLQTKTPGCWPWHPAATAELLVVWQQWDLATRPGTGPDELAAWHDRWRPGAARRLERLMAGCERAFGHHKDEQHQENIYDLACLDELAEWWATTHGTDPTRPTPGLTPDKGSR